MKKKLTILCSVLLAVTMLLAGCSSGGNSSSQEASTASEPESNKIPDSMVELIQFEDPQPGSEIVTMKTSMGDIKLMLFPKEAPKAVENFLTHAKEGYYNGLKFHRVMNEFMIQGGDPDGDGTGGESIWKTPFEDEFSLNLWHFRGALSMANSGSNTNGSQFFIVQATSVSAANLKEMEKAFPDKVTAKYKELGGAPWLDGRHTVFGYVIEGMDVVDKIAAVEVDGNAAPKEPVTILSFEFETVPGSPETSGAASGASATSSVETSKAK